MTIAHQFLTPSEAQRLTQRIKLTASTIRDSLFKLRNLVDEAKNSNVWQVLGYQSWTAYLADTLADEPMRLGRDERQELVGYLSGEGLSTRAIAPIVGTSHMQVKRDIDAGVTNVTPAPVESSPEADSPAPAIAEERKQIADSMFASAEAHLDRVSEGFAANGVPKTLLPDEFVVKSAEYTADVASEARPVAENVPVASESGEPRTITGLDGKTYTQAVPSAPRRKALTDSAKDVGWELRKATEKLQRVTGDDRFSRNKEEVAALIKGHLMFTVEVCQDLLDEFNN